MDLHDYTDVAENYDCYVETLTAPGFDTESLVAFHLRLAGQYGRDGILDIGCGTGVTLIPLVEHGYRVAGIDISQPMMDVAGQKLSALSPELRCRASLICSDMTSFEAEGQFSLAAIPRSGFVHLLTPGDQERALRNIHRHLTPEGVLSFNTFDPNYEIIAANLKGSNPAPQLRTEYTNSRGCRERIWNWTEYDPATQTLQGRWTFEEIDLQGQVIERRERPVAIRWTFETEMRHLLRLCGFEVMDTFSSYAGAPRQHGGWIIWVCRKGFQISDRRSQMVSI